MPWVEGRAHQVSERVCENRFFGCHTKPNARELFRRSESLILITISFQHLQSEMEATMRKLLVSLLLGVILSVPAVVLARCADIITYTDYNGCQVICNLTGSIINN